MIDANSFETHIRLAAYRSITDLLVSQNLITHDEAALIRKRISQMEETLVSPEEAESSHHERSQKAL